MSKSNTKSITVPALIDPHQRYTIPESSAILRQSVAKTYKDIKAGNLRIIVSLPVTPSFEPSAGTVGARTKVTPRRSVLD
jgi:hypothetical protein